MTWWLWVLVGVAAYPPSHLLAFIVLLMLGKALPGLAGRYCINLAASHDQHFNAIFGGYRDQTLSARMGLRVEHGPEGCSACWHISRAVCWLLGLIDRDHCAKYARVDASDSGKGVFSGRAAARRQSRDSS